VLSEGAGTLVTTGRDADGIRVITARGVLDTATYLPLRDTIIEAALDGACAVIVDVTELVVPTPSAWAVFTSARWHVSTWPDIPIVLISGRAEHQRTIARTGVTRYVPAHARKDAAIPNTQGPLSSHDRCVMHPCALGNWPSFAI